MSVLWAFTAQAQSQSIPGTELERLQLNPGARDSLVLSTGDLLQKGQYRLALTAHYERKPLVLLERDEQHGVIVSDRVTAHLSGAYAVTDWLELGAQVPIMSQWGPDTTALGVSSPETMALGTPWLQGRVGVLSEDRDGPMDLGVHLGVGLPLGSESALTKDQGFVFTPRLGLGKSLGNSWRVGADLGALVRTKKYALTPQTQPLRDELGVEMNGGVNVSAGLFGLREELVVRGTLPVANAPKSLEALLGLRAAVGSGSEVYVMGGPGFGQTPGTPKFRVLAGVSFGADGARVAECVEGRPYSIAECPDLDADGDGVKNVADRCPSEKGLAQLNGCADTDDDHDGIMNLADRCPAQAENINGFEDTDGCPDDPDSDGDGIADSKDACPNQAEDMDQFEDTDGCPDLDNDKDGIADAKDACINEPGPKENRGCPDQDRDGDGLVDRLDNCPDEKGPEKNKGCKEKQLAQIDEGQIRILESIYFEQNKDVISARSNKLLDTVASILASHPNIQKVRIEGHTDNKGDANYNMDLSQRRAEAVVKYLVNKAVSRERLESKGLGPTQPIADNKTLEGRAKNRRVEFKILGEAEGVQVQQGAPTSDTLEKN
ncbi:OmpA family protein [Corallococcus sp. H22C18031201]|uniref:OmpA family protein n=1 Tax=Citreicoccus inhibens TaxID=2849499 RepID=UPI000E733F48|nr:OmpA family protein [Citreicoccus inhibens]MBU8895291.1 OmpA family protein [Citreicoccus inhibens]RJS26183.1 OmpA family protein [Corallococcus sp. H22C18031201]